MNSDTVAKISTVAALKNHVRQLETQRVETFAFLPEGPLAAQCPMKEMGALALSFSSLAWKVSAVIRRAGTEVVRITCTLSWRQATRMLDAWRAHTREGLTSEEQQSLALAEKYARDIMLRKRESLDRLYMLYCFVASLITYRRGNETSEDFPQLIGAASVLRSRAGNCQGFAEVMYLIGSMMGLRMGIQCGRNHSESHTWSTVEMGREVYALDASAAANAWEQSERRDNAWQWFLMGERETKENGLSWTAEEETKRLTPTLSGACDLYRNYGVAASSLEEAAAGIWRRFLAGERMVYVRIRASCPITIEEARAALQRVAGEKKINREIGERIGPMCSYTLMGAAHGGLHYMRALLNG